MRKLCVSREEAALSLHGALLSCCICWKLGQPGACETQEDAGRGAGTAGAVGWGSPSSAVPWTLQHCGGRQMALTSCASLINSRQSYRKTFLRGMDGYQEVQTLLGDINIECRHLWVWMTLLLLIKWGIFQVFLHVLFSSAVAHNIEMISLEGDRDEQPQRLFLHKIICKSHLSLHQLCRCKF